jgi:hypothetical protein
MAAPREATPITPRCSRSHWRGSANVLEITSAPGAAWLEVVSRQTIQAFSCAFSADPILESTVIPKPLLGVGAIYDFFCTTRSMYDRISFVQEMRSVTRACFEWEGVFQGERISGATILAYDARGAIERIRLFHFPYEQLNAFSAELARRHSSKTESINPLTRSES